MYFPVSLVYGACFYHNSYHEDQYSSRNLVLKILQWNSSVKVNDWYIFWTRMGILWTIISNNNVCKHFTIDLHKNKWKT